MATSFDYRRQARTYDTTRAASPSVLAPLREALGRPVAGAGLLDVGGGTGNYAAAFAEDGWATVVVDRNSAMLRVADAKGLRGCRTDASALPFAAGVADAVVMISMLHHVPDWEAALAEARRVVRPGGTVALLCFTREHLDVLWVGEYLPRSLEHFRAGHQPVGGLRAELPGARELPVRYEDVVDGSLAALCRRPELLLDPAVRRQTSFIEWAEAHEPAELASGFERLGADLAAGRRPDREVAPRRDEIGDAVVMAWTRPR